MKFKIALLGLLSVLSAPAYAQSGCSGQPNSGYVCGNGQASAGLPGFYSQTTLLDRGFGSGQGTVLNRGVSGWLATVAPSLGVNGGTGGSIILNGATSGSATISVPAAAGSVTFKLPNSNGSNNQVLTTDGSGNLSWVSLSGTGTVTSVGLSMPGIFSVTGSPVTSNGTLTASLANQSANLVWAGPSTGAAAAPTFRSLVGADLPNPSSSTLGGIQSYAGVSSQWIRSISTSGVPASSQPAFSDISGTLAPTQCPASGLATLGCVNAINGTASQWLRALSTSGQFTSSQPTFADIAGAATLAQLPSISNNSVLGNNSGGTAVPSSLSASNVLDMLGSTQGQILYRGSGAWTALSPGTSGQVLTTNGAAANPSWTTVAGTGTVTSIATNNGITGGAITTTGTIGLDAIANGSVLANVSGVSQHPTATTPSAILDVIGSGTGSVLYRAAGGTGWQALAAGTNGQVLTMGASTPAWSNAGSVTNVTISAGTGISATGTCTISTSGTCTVATAAGVPANVLNSVTANYTVQTSDCGKTIQAGTGATGIFTLTLPSVSGFDTKCVVNLYNGDTSTRSGKLLSGFPAGCISTKYFLFPGVMIQMAIVNGAWVYSGCPGQYVPTSAMTLLVNATGSDTTGDGFTAPFATMQKCFSIFEQAVFYPSDLTQPTCQFTSNIVESAVHYYPVPGTNTLNISASSCAFTWKPSGSNIFALAVGNGGNVQLSCMNLSGTSTTCFSGSGASACTLVIAHNNNVVLETLASVTCTDGGASGLCMVTDTNTAGGSQINIDNGLTVAGTFSTILRVNGRSSVLWNSTLTASGTPTVGQIFQLTGISTMCIQGNFAVSGSFGAARQYAVLNGAQLFNVSGTAIPGSTTGITSAAGFNNGSVVATSAGGC